MDGKVTRLLEWIQNTVDADHKPSTHSYVLPKLIVKDDAEWGRGIYAQSSIITHDLLVRIPPSFLLNYTTVVCHITSFNPDIVLVDPHYLKIYVPDGQNDFISKSIYAKLSMESLTNLSSFQIISMFITLELQRIGISWWKPFLDMLPSMEDFQSMPLVWKVLKTDDDLIKYLPASTGKHAEKVVSRFNSDYNIVLNLLLSVDKTFTSDILPLDKFLWAWLCINSRCLYMDIPQKKSTTDNFTMAPYVDFLNHSSEDQCVLKIDTSGFQVLTGSTSYEPDQQIFLSYGPHSNEFLLCEYGFMLNENRWNDVDVSEYIIRALSSIQKDYLEHNGYLGDYTVNVTSGPSFRTEVAICTLQEKIPLKSRKLAALLGGIIDASAYSSTSKLLLLEIFDQLTTQPKQIQDSSTDDELRRTRKKVIRKLYLDIAGISASI